MIEAAIQRVLARPRDRAAIGSLADLKRAYVAELAAHGLEIAGQLVEQRQVRQPPRCANCDRLIENAQRSTRRYCSDACRVDVHRQRHPPAWRTA